MQFSEVIFPEPLITMLVASGFLSLFMMEPEAL